MAYEFHSLPFRNDFIIPSMTVTRSIIFRSIFIRKIKWVSNMSYCFGLQNSIWIFFLWSIACRISMSSKEWIFNLLPKHVDKCHQFSFVSENVSTQNWIYAFFLSSIPLLRLAPPDTIRLIFHFNLKAELNFECLRSFPFDVGSFSRSADALKKKGQWKSFRNENFNRHGW